MGLGALFVSDPAGLALQSTFYATEANAYERSDLLDRSRKKATDGHPACKVRMGVIEGTHAAKAGHPGGSLSAADLFTYLYFKEMGGDPNNPKGGPAGGPGPGGPAPGPPRPPGGAGGPPPRATRSPLRHIGSHLQGHPNMNETPGVDMSTGSLGQGVSAAAGMALAAKYQGKDYRVYTLLGDGEIQEGQVWEAFMFAHHYKLDNLCVIIDNNGLQIDGNTADVMSPRPHGQEA